MIYIFSGALVVCLVLFGWIIGEAIVRSGNKDPKNRRSPRWAFMARLDIPPDERPTYLRRLRIIQTPWFGVYIHRILGPDPEPILHDHPWSFLALVLRGGYTEVTEYDRTGLFGRTVRPITRRRIRWLNFKRATDTHYIESINRVPTVTLLFVGRRKREWGFIFKNGQWMRWDIHERNLKAQREQAQQREPLPATKDWHTFWSDSIWD